MTHTKTLYPPSVVVDNTPPTKSRPASPITAIPTHAAPSASRAPRRSSTGVEREKAVEHEQERHQVRLPRDPGQEMADEKDTGNLKGRERVLGLGESEEVEEKHGEDHNSQGTIDDRRSRLERRKVVVLEGLRRLRPP